MLVHIMRHLGITLMLPIVVLAQSPDQVLSTLKNDVYRLAHCSDFSNCGVAHRMYDAVQRAEQQLTHADDITYVRREFMQWLQGYCVEPRISSGPRDCAIGAGMLLAIAYGLKVIADSHRIPDPWQDETYLDTVQWLRDRHYTVKVSTTDYYIRGPQYNGLFPELSDKVQYVVDYWHMVNQRRQPESLVPMAGVCAFMGLLCGWTALRGGDEDYRAYTRFCMLAKLLES